MSKTINSVGTGSYRRRRRTAVAATGSVALLLAFASMAYACTLLIGEFTVCQPVSTTFTGSGCAKRSLTGPQTNLITFDDGGSAISIKGTNFSDPSGTEYSITFAVSGPSCHAFNVSGGVTSLLGVDGSGNPNTVAGPNFEVGKTSGSTGGYDNITTPAVSILGPYSVCAQDEPQRVDGSAILGTVSLL